MKQRSAFAMIMGVITTGLISFILICVNVGMGPHFIKIWFKSWLISYSIAIPAILVIGPKIQAFTDRLFMKKSGEI